MSSTIQMLLEEELKKATNEELVASVQDFTKMNRESTNRVTAASATASVRHIYRELANRKLRVIYTSNGAELEEIK